MDGNSSYVANTTSAMRNPRRVSFDAHGQQCSGEARSAVDNNGDGDTTDTGESSLSAWQDLRHFDRTRTRVEGTAQGYAGHQNYNHVGIVHMKGRIYDPTLGRFLQPDPIVEDDLNPQTWNRYTYVRNNPMTFTDPTGMASQCGERCQVRTARQRAADAVIATVMAHGSVFNGRAMSDVTPAGAAVSSTTPMCSTGDATTDGAQMSAVGPKIRGRSFQRQIMEAIAVPPAYALAYSIGNVPRVAVALSLYFGAEAAGRGDGPGVGLAMMGGVFARSGGALDDAAENVDDVLRGAQAAEAKAAMSTASQGTHALRAEQQLAGDAAAAVDDVTKRGTQGLIELTKARFGHAFSTHGQDATEFLTKRAAGSGSPMGQFLDDQAAGRLIEENLGRLKNGAISVPVPGGFPARIIMPNGSYAPASTIRLVPSGNGVKTAYPEL